MDFSLTPDQEMIRDTAESFLAEASSSQAVRRAMASAEGYDPTLWQRIGEELGWCATAIPEAFGGLGLSLVEQVLLMEQMGRRLVCAPYFSTACLAANALLEAATPAAKGQYLPDIAAGSLTATLALGQAGIDWRPDNTLANARPAGDGHVLDGVFRHVPDGATAQLLLIPARLAGAGEPLLFAVHADTPGLVRQAHATIDATRRLAEVRLDNAPLPASALIGAPGRVAEGLTRAAALAAIALAAEQLGGAQQSLDLTLAYIAERRQFGRTIASFQAIKHRCAEIMVRIEATRSAVLGAAFAAAAAPATAELALEAACAKALASDTYFHSAQEAIQLHGGVGFTWEYDPHLYFKRAQASSQWLGTSDALRERVAAALLD
jgi:alkylation response protein AidB-like acyl-CoA dehydrogenase